VDAEREAASGAVSSMKAIHGPVQEAAARIDESGNPINFMDSLSSTLKSLEKFNSVVDTIAMVRNHCYAFSTEAYGLIKSPDTPLCPSSMDSSQCCLQGSSIALVSNDKRLIYFWQTIIDQTNRDKDVCSLLTKMNEVYAFLTRQDVREIESMKTLVATICKQTLECSYFIQRYAQDAKFRKSVYRCGNSHEEFCDLSLDPRTPVSQKSSVRYRRVCDNLQQHL
jgi:hypothetical protein